MAGAKTAAGVARIHCKDSAECWKHAHQLENHLLLRIASLSLPATPHPTSKASLEKTVREYLSAERVLSECAARLVEALHRAVPRTPGKRQRALLLEMKRQAHRCDGIELSEGVPPPEVVPFAGEYRRTYSCLELAGRDLTERYQDAATSEREALQDVLRSSSELRNGIALASPQYFRAVERAISKDARISPSKLEKALRSLLSYYLRASTKAAPFSTFCLVAYAEMGTARTVTPVSAQSPVRTLRANKLLVRPIQALMRHDQHLRQYLLARRNTSIRSVGQRSVFVRSVDGMEAVQSVSRTPALALVDRVVGRREVQFGRLLEAVVSSSGTTARRDVEAFVTELVRIGYLTLNLDMPDQATDWTRRVKSQMARSRSPKGLVLLRLLDGLIELEGTLPSAEPATRAHAIQVATRRTNSLLGEMGVRQTLGRSIVYEDVTLPKAVPAQMMEQGRRRTVLAEYVRTTVPLAPVWLEHRTLASLFRRSFPGKESLPFLQFFEAYARDVQDRRASAESNRPGPDTTSEGAGSEAQAARLRITELIRERWTSSSGQDITLTLGDLRHAVGKQTVPNRGIHSVAFLVQTKYRITDGTLAPLVVRGGAYTIGCGKFTSRFLSGLPSSLLRVVRKANRSSDTHVLAEIDGDAFFNANLHPELCDSRIGYPQAQSDPGEPSLIQLHDLVITCGDDNVLGLRHRSSGQVVTTLDGGFINPRLREPLYQLLSIFTPSAMWSLTLPDRRGGEDHSKIRCRPRIALEDAITVGRRTWFIPSRLFPVRDPRESSSEHFLRVAAWRERVGIPETAYAWILGASQDGAAGSWAPPRDLQKPQFVRFSSPMMVEALSRLPAGLSDYQVVLEEVFPDVPAGEGSREWRAAELLWHISPA